MGKLMDKVMTVFEFAKGVGIILGGLSVIVGVFGFFIKTGKILKSIEVLHKDNKEIKESIKEVHTKLDGHGNRLTAIETTLRLAEWFGFSHEKATHE